MFYKIDDDTVLDTDNVQTTWTGEFYKDNNAVSIHTKCSHIQQLLHRSKRGRYFIEQVNKRNHNSGTAGLISNADAIMWLKRNNNAIPDDLKANIE